jgi:hypothetical protein
MPQFSIASVHDFLAGPLDLQLSLDHAPVLDAITNRFGLDWRSAAALRRLALPTIELCSNIAHHSRRSNYGKQATPAVFATRLGD